MRCAAATKRQLRLRRNCNTQNELYTPQACNTNAPRLDGSRCDAGVREASREMVLAPRSAVAR